MPKCGLCKKSMFKCKCHDTPTTIVKKNGEGVTGNKVDANGNEWCSQCSCRVMSGRCTNRGCSTHG